jgi:amidase
MLTLPEKAAGTLTQRAFRADVTPIATVEQNESFTLETVSILSTRTSTLPTTYEELVIPVTGPVFIDGVEPDDTLEIEILGLTIANVGAMVTLPGYGLFGAQVRIAGRVFEIADDLVEFEPGFVVPVAPMIGKLGVAVPDDPPPSSTVGHFGGNMDNKHLGVGSKLYLKAVVPGAMLYVGDLHACQADGESSLTALEVAGAATMRVNIVPRLPVEVPVVRTAESVMTVGDGDDLDAAVADAAHAMSILLQASNAWSFETSAMALSLVGDVGICQLVNPRVSGKVTVPERFVRNLGAWEAP